MTQRYDTYKEIECIKEYKQRLISDVVTGQKSMLSNMEDYSEYIIQGEPDKRERVRNWMTAIGLQDVDDLKPSQYFLDTVKQNIEGKITLEEVRRLVDQYYTTKEGLQQEKRTEEADKVAVRIAELIAHKTFSFRPNCLASIHRHLFEGIYKFAGTYRDYNITKPELVLRGDTVRYESGNMISDTLEYEFDTEKKFSYEGLTMPEMVKHISRFIANVWQIHPFGEGNTRTTAVFAIQFLRHLGFEVTNEIFAENSKYFRNSLVRANYTNMQYGITETTEYLERFFRNLLMGEQNELKSVSTQESTQEANKSLIEATQKDNFTTQKTLNTTQKKILNYLKEHPNATRKDMAAVIGDITEDGIKFNIGKLQQYGRLKREGGRKSGTWVVIDNDVFS